MVIGLPSGLKQQVLDTPAWKVLGTGLIILLAGTIVWLWHRLTRPPALDHRPISYLRRLLTPIALVAVILGVGYVIEDQINVIGDFADVVGFATRSPFTSPRPGPYGSRRSSSSSGSLLHLRSQTRASMPICFVFLAALSVSSL